MTTRPSTSPSKRTKTSTSPTSGMPPEIAQTLQQRGVLPPAAADAIPTATTRDEAMAKLEAMTAELAEQTGTALTKPSAVTAAVQDIVQAPATPAPNQDNKQSKKAAPAIRVGRALDNSNPNHRYTELPPAVEKFVQSALTAPALPSASFKNAAEYYAAHSALCSAIQTLPATVPAPFGWELNSDGTVDVVDILHAHGAGRQSEMLHDLIRWAVTVPLAQQAADAQTTLRNLQQRGEAADARLKDTSGAALLNKFNTLISLLQTQAFSGKPDLLAKCVLDDWEWLSNGIAYKTVLAELNGYPALFDSRSMTPSAFTDSGSLSEFMQQHQPHLISKYRTAVTLRDLQADSISVNAPQRHTWIQAERPLADADCPVLVTLGYQEVTGATEMNYDGLNTGWRDYTALTLMQDGDSFTIQPGGIPADSAVAAPVRDAVTVLMLLNEAGK